MNVTSIVNVLCPLDHVSIRIDVSSVDVVKRILPVTAKTHCTAGQEAVTLKLGVI